MCEYSAPSSGCSVTVQYGRWARKALGSLTHTIHTRLFTLWFFRGRPQYLHLLLTYNPGHATLHSWSPP